MSTTEMDDAKLACCVCDYDLRGHAPSARCPECGTPVKWSMPSYVPAASLAWIAKVRTGLVLLLIGFFSWFLAPMVTMSLQPPAQFDPNYDYGLRAVQVGRSLAWICGLAGVLVLSAPDSVVHALRKQDRSRRLVRSLAVIMLVIAMARSIAGPVYTFTLFEVAWAAGSVAVYAFTFLYLAQLARVFQKRTLAKEYIGLLFCIPLAPLIGVLFALVAGGGFWPLGGGPMSLLEIVIAFAPFVLVVVWLIVAIIRLFIVVNRSRSQEDARPPAATGN